MRWNQIVFRIKREYQGNQQNLLVNEDINESLVKEIIEIEEVKNTWEGIEAKINYFEEFF